MREKCESPKKSLVKSKASIFWAWTGEYKEKTLSVSGWNSQSLFFRIHCLSNTGILCTGLLYSRRMRVHLAFLLCLCSIFFGVRLIYSKWILMFIFPNDFNLLFLKSFARFGALVWVSIHVKCVLSGNYTYFYFVHFNRMRYLDIRIFVFGFHLQRIKK